MSSSSQDDQALFNLVSKQFSNAQQHLNNYGFGIQSNGSSENSLSPYESSGFIPSFPNGTSYMGSGMGGSGSGLNQAPPAHVGTLTSQPSWPHCASFIMLANNGIENCASQPYGYPGGIGGAAYYQGGHPGYHHHHHGPSSYGSYYQQLKNEFLSQPLNLSDSKVISTPSLVHRQPYLSSYVTAPGPSLSTPFQSFNLNDRYSLFETGISEIENEDDNEIETGSSDVSESETPQIPNSFLVKSRTSAFDTVLPTNSLNRDFLLPASPEDSLKIEELPTLSDILTTATPALLSGQTIISPFDVPVVRTPDSSEKLSQKRRRGRPLKDKANLPHHKGNFTKQQVGILEEKFADYPFIRNATERKSLAERLNVTEHRITVWFQNRRTKERRSGALPKGTLPSNYFK